LRRGGKEGGKEGGRGFVSRTAELRGEEGGREGGKKKKQKLGKDRMKWLLWAEGPEVRKEGGREGGRKRWEP